MSQRLFQPFDTKIKDRISPSNAAAVAAAAAAGLRHNEMEDVRIRSHYNEPGQRIVMRELLPSSGYRQTDRQPGRW